MESDSKATDAIKVRAAEFLWDFDRPESTTIEIRKVNGKISQTYE